MLTIKLTKRQMILFFIAITLGIALPAIAQYCVATTFSGGVLTSTIATRTLALCDTDCYRFFTNGDFNYTTVSCQAYGGATCSGTYKVVTCPTGYTAIRASCSCPNQGSSVYKPRGETVCALTTSIVN